MVFTFVSGMSICLADNHVKDKEISLERTKKLSRDFNQSLKKSHRKHLNSVASFQQAERLMQTPAFKKKIAIIREQIRTLKYKNNQGHPLRLMKVRALQSQDLGKMMERARVLARHTKERGYKLYIFISFSMPGSSIKNLYNDADKIGSPLMVRGLINNNFTKTAQKMVSIIGKKNRQKRNTTILINPVMFKSLKIKRVPAFVFIKGEPHVLACRDRTACAKTMPKHDVVYGDITLRKAIETFAATNQDVVLDRYLKKLKGRL